MSQSIAVATSADPSFEEGQGGLLSMDLTGHLRTTGGGGGGGGGTSEIDESAFTAGATPGTPAMGADLVSNEVVIFEVEPGTRIQKVSATVPVSNAASVPSQTTVGTTSILLLAANANRKGFVVQNQGTTTIKLLLGATAATQSNYTVGLPMCGSPNDGSSAPWYGIPGVVWAGQIQVISSAAGGLVEVVELT